MALTALQAYNLEKALGRGQLVEAIKLYREATGCDLTTAKIEVDKFAADLKKRKPWLFKDQAMPESSGVDASGAIRKSRFNPKALLLFFLVDGLIFAGIIYYFVFYQPEQRAERRAERASSTAVQTSSGNQGRPASQRLIPPTSPDQYTAAISDADSFASLYRQKIQSRDYIARKSSSSSRRYDDSELERQIKTARSELAKMRPLPDNQSAVYIPLTEGQPTIDGILETSEWQGAIVLAVDEELGTDLYLQTDGEWLFIACDARGEKTPGGYDQLRVYFHAGLLENLVNERIHIGRSGGVTSIRQTRFRWQGKPPKNDDERWKKYQISDWGLYQYAAGTSSMSAGHRQYEAAIHLGEAGLHAGAPFTVYVEVETDPLRNDAGKFVERRYLGHYGSEAQPKWLVF